jgi:hypothetical protein
MTWVEDTSLRHRLRLPVVAALVVTALMAPVVGASATSSSPSSQSPCAQANCVFVLDKGRFKTIEFPFPADPEDSLVGINHRGRIVGGYIGDAGASHGYLRDRRGRFITIDVAGAAGTLVYDLNDRRQIVGIYSNTDARPPTADDTRGFLRDERGRFTTIHAPGAVRTQAFGINNRAQVGEYLDAGGRVHGFLWDKGRFTTIDGPDGAVANATDINDRGEIVGLYADPTDPGTVDGFLLSKRVYTTFDAPDAALTIPFGINNRGQIVGVTTTDPRPEPAASCWPRASMARSPPSTSPTRP